MNYILYNSLANKHEGRLGVEAFKKLHRNGNFQENDVIGLDFTNFFATLTPADTVYLVGGDGTVNRLVNALRGMEIHNDIYLFKWGTGNDLFRDVTDTELMLLNPYIHNLPCVHFQEKEQLFVNGVGFGIDGQVCEVAQQMMAKGNFNINYATLSIQLLLKGYRCPDATVTVDSQTMTYHHVWLASTMKGRYYGGGMMIAPKQNRKNDTVSCVIMYGAGKLKTLAVFPSIFKGEHINHPEMVEVLTGKHIRVEFSIPTAMQIDGEVFSNITSYEVDI